MAEEKKLIQWHPAFTASIQIEFEEERDKLLFEEEHLLSKKPMQIDELIIKVKKNTVIRKNIGRIFRQYNIVEYKSPNDNLSINDFYKVYGYTCFYQSDTAKTCEISPDELTITFVCNKYPRQMIKHLCHSRDIGIEPQGAGIYYLIGDEFPMQIIVTKELNPEENRWLQSLRNDIDRPEELEQLLQEYEGHRDSKLYQAAMNVITRANWRKFEEAKTYMCEALRELMADEFEEKEREVTEEVTLSLAKKMKENGILPAQIAEVTGLDMEKIEAL